jgi:hypothetical protein
VYTHYTAAHEETGQHAQTLDRYTKEYLEYYIDTYGQTYDLAIFLAGDHGMRYGEFLTGMPAI